MKKIIIVILVSLFLVKAQNAQAVWSNVGTDFGIFSAEQIAIQVRAALAASAKMFAIRQVQYTIDSLLSGGTASPRYIKNYQEYLFEDAKDQAIVMTEEFLTTSLKGKTSGNYYFSDMGGGSEEGVSMGYNDYMESVGLSVIADEDTTVDITEVCDPMQAGIFEDGNWDCFNTMFSKQENLPVGLALTVEEHFANAASQYQKEAEVKAQSSGFLPLFDENGDIKLPTGVNAELQIMGVTMPIDAIVNADTEVFATIIQAAAVTAITSVVEYGLGEVEKSYQDSVDKFSREYSTNFNNTSTELGPGVKFNTKLLYD
jgi:hypothetical protein